MTDDLAVTLKCPPALDPAYVPAKLWNQAYQSLVEKSAGSHPLTIALERSDGDVNTFATQILPDDQHDTLTERYVERLVKFLLWQKGGRRVIVGGSDRVAESLRRTYCAGGQRAFDWEFVGGKLFLQNLEIDARPIEQVS